LSVTRERKVEIVDELVKDLKQAQALILTDYRGLPTAELAGLRNQLRGMQSGFHVAKNTLVKLALEKAGLPVPEDMLEGPTAIAFCFGDVSAPAKALTNFLKEKELAIKGAIMSGRVLKGAEAAALATLPSREQMYARLLGTMNAPSTKVVGVVASGIRQVLYLLKARAEQLQKQTA